MTILLSKDDGILRSSKSAALTKGSSPVAEQILRVISIIVLLQILYFTIYKARFENDAYLAKRLWFGKTKDSQLSYELDEYRHEIKHNQSRVIVWMPHSDRCRGNFTLFSRIADQDPGKPALLIREVALDRRHVSLKEYRLRHGFKRSFRRIVVFLTAVPHNTSAIVSEPLRAAADDALLGFRSEILTGAGVIARDLHSTVDYFLTDKRCARACSDFTPCRNKEWQIIVTVFLLKNGGNVMLDSRLENLEAEGGFLSLTLPIKMRDNSTETFEANIGLSCIAALTSATALPLSPHLHPREEECIHARGSLAISGGPLFGGKRKSPAAWREIAHYAARCLFGSMWFDSVAVGVIPEFTMAQIEHICGHKENSAQCVTEMHNKNLEYIRTIAETVEEVFVQLEIPPREWSRLILFPFCRLGSDFQNSENHSPCRVSHHNGQKPLGHAAYTMFGPYHKWVSNLDLDEFVVKEQPPTFLASSRPRQSKVLVRSQSAESQFDSMMAASGNTSFRMQWFDFRVTNEILLDLSYAVTRDNELNFVSYNLSSSDRFEQTFCYMAGNIEKENQWGGGKVAQHCRDGFGFMVHEPFNLWKARDSLILDQADCLAREKQFPPPFPVYTYHARLDKSRFGRCEFMPRS